MLPSHPIDLPLTAARTASRILRDEWHIGRDSRRIRLESREGEW